MEKEPKTKMTRLTTVVVAGAAISRSRALEAAVRAYEDATGKLASAATQKGIGAACAAYEGALNHKAPK